MKRNTKKCFLEKRKKLKHEWIAIILAIIGCMLLMLSTITYGWSEWTGILQGIGTGLFTGVVVLLVGGTKTHEITVNNGAIEYINKYAGSIAELYDIEINIQENTLKINNVKNSIIMVPYVAFKIINFFEQYDNDEKFERIMSSEIIEIHNGLKKDYYNDIKKAGEIYSLKKDKEEEVLIFANKINTLLGGICEEILDLDFDLKIGELILKYNKNISELNNSRI